MLKALIIDDERPVRLAVTKLANWGKYNIEEPLYAENGMEGLEIMKKESIHIVFIDMNMPIMNGPEFLKRASEEYPDTKYIVISGYDDFSYAKTAMRYGASEYILKPVDENELNQAIGRIVKELDQNNQAAVNMDEEQQAQLPPEKVIKIIRQYIDEHFDENIHLSDFSKKYYYSKEYLIKLFKQNYKTGIYEYLQDVRMKHAKSLLEDENNQIQIISARLGFSDTNYFSKAFKKYYGITPSTYRKNYKEETIKRSNIC